MESFNKQDTIKKSFDKQPTISTSSSLTTTTTSPQHLYQDTNYIGITINDDIPKYNSAKYELDQAANEPYSPIYKSPHKRFNQVIMEEEETSNYRLQPEVSGAFLKINSQADLPMSHHRRAREGKRYGVKSSCLYHACSIVLFIFSNVASLHADLRTKSNLFSM